ncbi:MAG TPA: AAA family ATPase [Ktedonobacterales bacterium]
MASPQTLTLGGLLRRYRLAAGLTQEELAEKAGLSVNAISALERGISRAPRHDTVTLLAGALGLQPAERALFERAARQRDSVPSVASPVASHRDQAEQAQDNPPFVGRAAELAAIDRVLAGAGASLLLVAGEPGIGKSRLLSVAAERAPAAGWTVVHGACHRHSVAEPYAPFPAALLRLLTGRSPAQQRLDLHGCGWLSRLLPELTEAGVLPAPTWTLPPEQERRLMIAAVGRLLANVARPAGTLLLLDDMQWAGADALALLAALLRDAPERERLRVIVAYRGSDVTPRDALAALEADLARERLATRLSLGPLARGEAAALLDALLADAGSLGEAERERVLRLTGGVPYFVVSVARELMAEADGISTAVDATEAGGIRAHGVVPWSVAASIRQRVAALTEPAREVVALVAIAGASAPYRVLLQAAEALGRDEAECVAAIDDAVHAQLLAELGDDAYACTHELIREALLAEMAAARRGYLHRLVGDAIERLAEPERLQRSAALAWHFARAGVPERALPYALLAGDRAAAVSAHAEAEARYRMALGLARELGDQAREAEAHQKLGVLFDNLGRLDEAIAMLERAARGYWALGDRERLARAIHRLARALHRAGRIVEGVEHLQALVIFLTPANADDPAEQYPDLAGPRAARALGTLTPAAAAPIRSNMAVYLAALGRAEEALPVIEDAAARARGAGDVQAQVLVNYMRGNILRDLGRLDDAERAWDESSLLARETGSLDFQAIALSNLGLARMAHGELAQARALHVQALEVGALLGDPYLVAWSRGDLAELAFIGGEWGQARTGLESALEAVRARPPGASRAAGLTYGAGMPLALLGRLDLAEGRTDEGLLALDEVLRLSENSTASGILPWTLQVIAEHHLLAGDPEAVRRLLEPAFGADGARESALPATLAWALLELGAHERARQMIEATVALARARRLRLVLVEALPVLARTALGTGRMEDAAHAADAALALARALPYPYAEAKALFARGLVYAAGGIAEQAGACYANALAILRRLGERPYAGLIERSLAGMGRT